MMINNITDAITALRHLFPQFRKNIGDDDRMSFDNDLPYLVFGDFAIFLKGKLELVEKGRIPKCDKDILNSFQLLERLILSGRSDLLDLVEIGVLEVIMDNPLTSELATDLFSPAALKKYKSLTMMDT